MTIFRRLLCLSIAALIVLPQAPAHADALADLVAGLGYIWISDDKDSKWESVPLEDLRARLKFSSTVDNDWVDQLPKLRQDLLESALAMDDDAFERLLETGEHDPVMLKKCIRKGAISGKLVPVFCGSSYRNKGVQQLLDGVVDYLPYPGENGGISMVDEDGKVIGEQEVTDDAPARALAFKVINDQFGTLTFCRVYSGVIKKGDAENLVIVCGVFIHPAAADDKKIYDYNYEATKMAIKNAMEGKPSADEMVAGKDAVHPFRGF